MQEAFALTWLLRRASGLPVDRVPNVEEWDVSLRDLGSSRCLSLAAYYVSEDGIPVSRGTRLALAAATSHAEAAVSRSHRQLRELGEALEGRGMSWVVLKGLPLAARLYPTAACRPSGDVDLLVAPADIAGSDGILRGLGYEPTEALDPTFHHRRYDRAAPTGQDIVELHWASDPPSFVPPPTSRILEGRRRFDLNGTTVWIPDEAMERDLLVRHFARHAGLQAILHLDLLLVPGEDRFDHPLGALVRDDLARLGLPLRITGPDRWRHAPLRRWMASRSFAKRREIGSPAVYQVVSALALAPTSAGAIREIFRYLWPSTPSQHWRGEAGTWWGGRTWRLRRLRKLVGF